MQKQKELICEIISQVNQLEFYYHKHRELNSEDIIALEALESKIKYIKEFALIDKRIYDEESRKKSC